METCNLYSKGSGSLAVTAAKTDYENSTAAALLVAIYSSPLPGCQRDYLAELCTQKVHRACACVTSEAQDGAHCRMLLANMSMKRLLPRMEVP